MFERLVHKHDSLFQRVFEIIPGLLIWLFLLAPLFSGISITTSYFVINMILVFAIYWLFRSVMTTLGSIIGYFNYREDIKQNWLEQCNFLDKKTLPDQDTLPKDRLLPKQLIVIANYGEEYPVLKRSINALINQNYPKELIYLSVSIEERKAKKDPDYLKRGEYLRRDFGEYFGDRLMFFIHPDNIEGEAIGAASNRAWGTKNSVIELEKRGEEISEFLITAPDGDLVFHKEYLAALTYKWLTSEKRNQKFYQTALYTFNNNYWDVPILIRILMISLTIPVLASSVFEKDKRETWSCFTLNLKVMKDVDYWDTSLAIDDTTFYWRPYFHFKGYWFCEVFFIPLSADAIYHPNYFKNHSDQYKQYLRWGWGIITVPLALKKLLADNQIDIFTKLLKVYHLFEVFVLGKVIAFLLAFGIPIILFLNTNLTHETLSYYSPFYLSKILSVSFVFIIPTTIIKLLLIPPKPVKMSIFKFIFLIIVETPLTIMTLFTFSFFPFLEASTRMMLGQKHTKLIRWSDKQLVANQSS